MEVQTALAVSRRPLNRVTAPLTSPLTYEPMVCVMRSDRGSCFLDVVPDVCGVFLQLGEVAGHKVDQQQDGPRMMFLMASHAPAAMVLMPFQMPESVFFRFSHSLMVSVTAFITDCPACLPTRQEIAQTRPEVSEEIPDPFQTVSAVDFMPSQRPVKKSLIPFHAPSAVDLIPSHRPEKKSPIPFQIEDAVP